MRVSLFIVGVQKGGTTALDRYLRRSPQVQMALDKEPHFFDDDALDWEQPDYGLLHARFNAPAATTLIHGEATPIYSYWPNSIERLQIYNPDAKLILMLRHPSLRAYSAWKMVKYWFGETLPFHEAIGDIGRCRVRESPGGVHRLFSYVERGFYASQIQRLLRHFDRRQVLFLRTDHLWRDTAGTLQQVWAHIDVDPPSPSAREYMVPRDSGGHERMRDEDRVYLDRLFESDLRATADLTGLNLTDWLDPDYQEPMQDAASE
jgi:hypothetical protein